jgi:hypothetical protein
LPPAWTVEEPSEGNGIYVLSNGTKSPVAIGGAMEIQHGDNVLCHEMSTRIPTSLAGNDIG